MWTTNVNHLRVEATSFNEEPSLSNINKGWFVNLSSIPIPKDIQSLLQLDDNFSLPDTDPIKLTTEFMKNIENNIKRLLINE